MGPMKLRSGEGVWLSRLKITNFRSIASLDLEFRHRLTVLIGANGAGKTTVLDAIALLLRPTGMTNLYGCDFADARKINGVVVGAARLEMILSGFSRWIQFGGPEGSMVTTDNNDDYLPAKSAHFGAQRDVFNSFDDLVTWFREKDIEEARKIRELGDLSFRHPELAGVRRAVSAMIPGTANLRIDPATDQLITDQIFGDRTETFEVMRLAGGLRAMLLLVADLAKLIVVHAGLSSSKRRVIVLVDEIDLHLHPKWQLDVVGNLLTAFPEVQFILTTHSEEIIASVPSECVVALQAGEDGVVARSIPAVQGATFDRVLTEAMGVSAERPPDAQAMLDTYWGLVDGGEGESDEGLKLRGELDQLFRGTEPDLVRADLAIRRNRARRGIGARSA